MVSPQAMSFKMGFDQVPKKFQQIDFQSRKMLLYLIKASRVVLKKLTPRYVTKVT